MCLVGVVQSVLENHHCVVAFGLLREHDVFANLSSSDKRAVSELLSGMVGTGVSFSRLWELHRCAR